MEGEESSSLRTIVSIRNAGAGENQKETIQSYPSPEFLNSLPFIKKFHPTPRWGEGRVTDVTLKNSNNLRQYEPKQLLSVIIPSDSEGIQPINKRHSEGSNNLTPKNLVTSNQLDLSLIAQDDDNILIETVHSAFTTHHSLKHAAFTLAEVLITLGIIGVVAAITIPALISNYQDKLFKTAYKKAYSDMSQALQEGIAEQKFSRTTKHDVPETTNEMNVLMGKFKIVKYCPYEKRDISPCWIKGDTICGGSCATGKAEDGIDYENGVPDIHNSSCFVDASGRSWCTFGGSENIFFVDTNGFAKPNLFGKDRFIFTFSNAQGRHTNQASDYIKVIPYAGDTLRATWYCKHPPCYYHSWLYN